MPIQMVFHEGRDEIIAVVVSGAQAKLELDASALAGALKKLGAQLFFKKPVGLALVDQERGTQSAVPNKTDQIMLPQGSLFRAKLPPKALLSPGAWGGCKVGGEAGNGFHRPGKHKANRAPSLPPHRQPT